MTNKKNTQSKAAQRERYLCAAEHYLERRGYDVLERGWKCPAGTADLIVSDGNYLVFVEVKGRSDADKGFSAEATNAEKREKRERIAAMYLRDYPMFDICVRFDAVDIIAYGTDRAFIKYYINQLA